MKITKIYGKVSQIIRPEEQHKFINPYSNKIEDILEGKFLVVVRSIRKIPSNNFILMCFGIGIWDYRYLAMKECPYQVNDLIEVNITPIMKESDFNEIVEEK